MGGWYPDETISADGDLGAYAGVVVVGGCAVVEYLVAT